jgi:maleate cis-trans isomerase
MVLAVEAAAVADTLGWRTRFGVLVPSTNTAASPEYALVRRQWAHRPSTAEGRAHHMPRTAERLLAAVATSAAAVTLPHCRGHGEDTG